MTVAALLDKLVSLDRRYAWQEMDGVIVVRPAAAWVDEAHFLHRVSKSFVHESLNLGAAHTLANGVLGSSPFTDRVLQHAMDTSPDPDYRFAVKLAGAPTSLDVL